jgi:predicted glutamine amidotransferase
MCRLLGTVSRTPVTLDQVLGDERDAFFAPATQHGDGRGPAWVGEDGLEVREEPVSALSSPELDGLAAQQVGPAS